MLCLRGVDKPSVKDIDASLRKACTGRWKLTRKQQYTLMDLLSR